MIPVAGRGVCLVLDLCGCQQCRYERCRPGKSKGGRAMALKPDGKAWMVREQIVDDPASGLTLQFEVDMDGNPRLRLFRDDLPFGNREIIFDKQGAEAAAGTVVGGFCRPAWMERVDD
jgi:hypothetical protein